MELPSDPGPRLQVHAHPSWASRVRIRLVAGFVVPLLATSCGSAGTASGGDRGTVTVLAAASLTEAFTAVGTDFRAAHPGRTVEFSFAGSSQLAQQIRAGAPADVFAAAGPEPMRTVVDGGDAAGRPRIFARNRVVIAVPEGNPKGVRGLADLSAPGVQVALCAPAVPCGAAARQTLDAAGVSLTPATLESDVKAALAKVRLGEVDAALVYVTDVRAAADEVDAVRIPDSVAAVNDYPIVVVAHAPHPAAAEAFVAYVLSEPGRRALSSAGFQVP